MSKYHNTLTNIAYILAAIAIAGMATSATLAITGNTKIANWFINSSNGATIVVLVIAAYITLIPRPSMKWSKVPSRVKTIVLAYNIIIIAAIVTKVFGYLRMNWIGLTTMTAAGLLLAISAMAKWTREDDESTDIATVDYRYNPR
jgi:hypothetical protein